MSTRAAATVGSTLLAGTVACAAVAVHALLPVGATAISRAVVAVLAAAAVATAVPADDNGATAAALADTLVHARAVPGRLTAVGVHAAHASLTRAPAATGEIGFTAAVVGSNPAARPEIGALLADVATTIAEAEAQFVAEAVGRRAAALARATVG